MFRCTNLGKGIYIRPGWQIDKVFTILWIRPSMFHPGEQILGDTDHSIGIYSNTVRLCNSTDIIKYSKPINII